MQSLVPIQDVISASELLKRWYVNIQQLEELAEDGLHPYFLQEVRQDSADKVTYCCRWLPEIPQCEDQSCEVLLCYDIDYVVFDMDEVRLFEDNHRYFLRNYTLLKNIDENQYCYGDDGTLSAESLCKLLSMSPKRFTEFVNKYKIKCYTIIGSYGKDSVVEKYYGRSDFVMRDIFVHFFRIDDLRKLAAPELVTLLVGKKQPEQAQDPQCAGSDVASDNSMNYNLQTNDAAIDRSQSQPRIAARDESTAARWEKCLEIVVRLAFRSMKEDKISSERELWTSIVRKQAQESQLTDLNIEIGKDVNFKFKYHNETTGRDRCPPHIAAREANTEARWEGRVETAVRLAFTLARRSNPISTEQLKNFISAEPV